MPIEEKKENSGVNTYINLDANRKNRIQSQKEAVNYAFEDYRNPRNNQTELKRIKYIQ